MDNHPTGFGRLPCPSGSTLVRHHPCSATDFLLCLRGSTRLRLTACSSVVSISASVPLAIGSTLALQNSGVILCLQLTASAGVSISHSSTSIGTPLGSIRRLLPPSFCLRSPLSWLWSDSLPGSSLLTLPPVPLRILPPIPLCTLPPIFLWTLPAAPPPMELFYVFSLLPPLKCSFCLWHQEVPTKKGELCVVSFSWTFNLYHCFHVFRSLFGVVFTYV